MVRFLFPCVNLGTLYELTSTVISDCQDVKKWLHVYQHIARFGYFDFRQNFLNLSRNSAFLPKILCRIQIWASKREIQAGQNFKHQKKTKNFKKYCTQNGFR